MCHIYRYAYCLGRYSEFLIKFSQERRITEAVEEIVSLHEVEFLQKLNNTHNHGISPFEFLQMELLRTGKCDQNFLDKVAKRFSEFDIVSDGEITLQEIIAANIFESYDVDDSDKLEFDEFRHMIKFLISGKWNKRFGRIVEQDITDDKSIREVFNVCDSSGDGVVSRGEFLEWISHISINQLVLWRGRVKFHSKSRKNDDYIVVMTEKSLEFRPAEASDAILCTTEALRLKHVEKIRFDDEKGIWISISEKSEFVRDDEDVVTLEVQKQRVADKLLRACLKCTRLNGKISGVRMKRLQEEEEMERKRAFETKIDMSGGSCVLSSRAEEGNRKRLNFNIFRAMSNTARNIRDRSSTVRNSIFRILSPSTPSSPLVPPISLRKSNNDSSTSSKLEDHDGSEDDDIGLDGIELSGISPTSNDDTK